MPGPFPGMDPYFEQRGLWEQVHADLIVDIRRFLTPLVRPQYHVAMPGQNPIVAELPMPEEVRERYLEIRDVTTHEVVTVIEILSPTNKLPGEGRAQYERKRMKVLASLTNLVEIDLIRAGQPFAVKASLDVARSSDYRMIISRSQQRPRADLYLFSLRDPIPDIPIPLRPGETEPVLKLNQILHNLYDQGGYDLAIDYHQPPAPPLPDEDSRWAANLLADQN